MGDANLKAVVDAVFDGRILIQSVIANKGFNVAELIPAEKLVMEVPGLIAAFPKLSAEIKALDPSVEADMAAYIVAKFSADSAKAQKVAAAIVAFVFSGYELEKAIAG